MVGGRQSRVGGEAGHGRGRDRDWQGDQQRMVGRDAGHDRWETGHGRGADSAERGEDSNWWVGVEVLVQTERMG